MRLQTGSTEEDDMSDWQEYSLQDKVVQILAAVPPYKADHHFGRPYLSAYQIAIKLRQEFWEEIAQMGRPIGGAGSGEPSPLAWYIADQLSKRISQHEITNIQGAFLRTDNVMNVAFNNDGERIEPSTLPYLTLFRLSE